MCPAESGFNSFTVMTAGSDADAIYRTEKSAGKLAESNREAVERAILAFYEINPTSSCFHLSSLTMRV